MRLLPGFVFVALDAALGLSIPKGVRFYRQWRSIGISMPRKALFSHTAFWAVDREIDAIRLYRCLGPLKPLASGVDMHVLDNLRLLIAYFARHF